MSETPERDARGVVANQRLTALTGGMLFLLLGLIGITILSVRSLLPQHLLLGFVLIPPIALKTASTGYRFMRYYLGDRSYRLAGPPPLYLRLLAPIVVVMTVAVFVTGLELWFFGLRFGSIWIAAHKLSFIVWLPATALHVLAHANRTTEVVAQEISSPGPDFFARRSLVVGSLVAGAALAAASLTYASPFIFFGDG
jgi:hypothetical protein